MKGAMRLHQIRSSTPGMARALPELPMQGTTMVRILRATMTGLGAYLDPVFRAMGLTENGYHVLCLLIAEPSGSASPTELSEMVGTSRANITRLLEGLEKQKYVVRTIDKQDARRHVIKITPKGRAKALETAPLLQEPVENAFSDLNEKEFELLGHLLEKLIVSLDKPARSLRAVA